MKENDVTSKEWDTGEVRGKILLCVVDNYSTSVQAKGGAEDQISETKGSSSRDSLLADRRFLSLMTSLTACVRPACDLGELRRTIQARQNPAMLHMAAAVSGSVSTSQRRRSSQITERVELLRRKNRNFTNTMLGKPAVIVE